MATVVTGLTRTVLAPLPAWPKAHALGRFIDISVPIRTVSTAHGILKFFCPGHNPVDRAFQLHTKESDTIAWLSEIQQGDVLWDVGANVGTYALYAALSGVTVCAFEPEASNYWILNRNLDLNEMHDRVKALNVALSDSTGLTKFALSKALSGTAKHPGVSPDEIVGSSRTVIAFTGRDIARMFGLPMPTHLKIDVDGHELSVLREMDLNDERLRSAQVEVRGNGDAEEICKLLARHGLALEGSLDTLKERGGKATNFLFRRLS